MSVVIATTVGCTVSIARPTESHPANNVTVLAHWPPAQGKNDYAFDLWDLDLNLVSERIEDSDGVYAQPVTPQIGDQHFFQYRFPTLAYPLIGEAYIKINWKFADGSPRVVEWWVFQGATWRPNSGWNSAPVTSGTDIVTNTTVTTITFDVDNLANPNCENLKIAITAPLQEDAMGYLMIDNIGLYGRA